MRLSHERGRDAVLRRAEDADAPGIAEVFLAARHHALPYLPSIHSDDETRRWIATTVVPSSQVWVAELDGMIAGFASLRGNHLDHLYVRPGHDGLGIGDRLLAKAKTLSPSRLRLFTFQRNDRARRFYEARGFVPIRFGDGSGNEEGEPDILYEWVGPG